MYVCSFSFVINFFNCKETLWTPCTFQNGGLPCFEKCLPSPSPISLVNLPFAAKIWSNKSKFWDNVTIMRYKVIFIQNRNFEIIESKFCDWESQNFGITCRNFEFCLINFTFSSQNFDLTWQTISVFHIIYIWLTKTGFHSR